MSQVSQSQLIEQQQEEMLKSKYPNLKPKTSSNLLQKRMSQKKYFDSGDYNMAQAKFAASKEKISPEVKQLNQVTGDHMPTPDELPRVRKPSISSLVASEPPTN